MRRVKTLPGRYPGRASGYGDLKKTVPCAKDRFYWDPGVTDESRWRETMVVVRQFSLGAISRIHPITGIRCGRAGLPA
jgi:hypothetical protein